MDALLQDAKRYKPVFDAMLAHLFQEAQSKGYGNDVSLSQASNKGRGRCLEKIHQKYGCNDLYGARQLSDVVRGSLVFRQEKILCRLVSDMLVTDHGVLQFQVKGVGLDPKTNKDYEFATLSITHSKNRFHHNALGMRDYLVNIRMMLPGDPVGHVGELQLHHAAMMEAKHHFHCVYSYLRRIDEGRNFLKLDDNTLFCDEMKCDDYHVDKKRMQKDGSMRSVLDIMRTKWVECDGSKSSELNMFCRSKDGKSLGPPTATKETKGFWRDLVQPFLKKNIGYYRGDQLGEYPENSIKRHEGYHSEHSVYAAVKGEMIKRYDEAAFKIYGDGKFNSKIPSTNQHCPPKVKGNSESGHHDQDHENDKVGDDFQCKCSQKLSLPAVESFPTLEIQKWLDESEDTMRQRRSRVTRSNVERWLKERTCTGEVRQLGALCGAESKRGGVAAVGMEEEEEEKEEEWLSKACDHFVEVCALEMCDLLNEMNKEYGRPLPRHNVVVALGQEEEVVGEEDDDDDVYE